MLDKRCVSTLMKIEIFSFFKKQFRLTLIRSKTFSKAFIDKIL